MDIYYTLDGSRPSNMSTKYSEPIKITANTNIQTIAYKGAIFSEIKTASIEKQRYTEAKKVQPTTGSFNRWENSQKAKSVAYVNFNTDVSPTLVKEINLSEFADKASIALLFKGYFNAEEDGLYEFATKSDDGSLLYIGKQLVVDNGGNHAGILRDGMIALKKGWHPITVKYHQGGGGSELAVWYKTPNGERKVLKGSIIGY